MLNKSLLFRLKRFLSSIMIAYSCVLLTECIATAQPEPQKSTKYCNRGDRMEGLDPPRDVAGVDIQIKAVMRLPFLSGEIAEDDSVYLSFSTAGQSAFDVSVWELRTNYLMKPNAIEVTDGDFVWPTAEVLFTLANQHGVGYHNLLPLAMTPESTPRLAYVAPVRLSISKTEFESEGYRFICVSNADFEAVFTIQHDSLIVRQGYLKERAGNLFSIEWDGLHNAKPIDEGEYVLHLQGEASTNAVHRPVNSSFFFYHCAQTKRPLGKL